MREGGGVVQPFVMRCMLSYAACEVDLDFFPLFSMEPSVKSHVAWSQLSLEDKLDSLSILLKILSKLPKFKPSVEISYIFDRCSVQISFSGYYFGRTRQFWPY